MFIYRIIATLIALATLPRAALRGEWRARVGRVAPAQGPHIWLHGASNGELASAKPIITALRQLRPDLGILVTTNTATGVTLVRSWDIIGVSAHLAPLDLQNVTRRVLRNWRIKAYISLETEIWPHRILSCPGPVIALGARMSEKTSQGWSKLPGLSLRVFGRLAYASAQDAASLGRLFDLGLPQKAGGPVVDLKAFYVAPDIALPDDLARAFERDKTWLAASTHEGEDEIALNAHQEALRHDPDLKLILAPRHPNRADAIEALIRDTGLPFTRRSRNEPADQTIYLADTMGDMPLWYRLAGRVFVAGSLARKGGHTPYEPSAFGCALIHGPDTRNFRAAYARLADQTAAIQITSASELARALTDLSRAQAQADLGAKSQYALAQDADPAELVRDVLNQLARV